MAYKILYIEDLDPDSIKSDLENCGIETDTLQPKNFNDTLIEMCKDEYDAILLDFRLQDGHDGVMFDAPTLAQTLRTKNVEDRKFKPMFLITNQKNISSYYKDFSSHDLFDYVNEKGIFRKRIEEQCVKIKSFIDAYQTIIEKNCDIVSLLNAKEEQVKYIDYRVFESLTKEHYKDNVHKIAYFIYHKIIKSFNFLIGEDILSARLGISKNSKDWNNLLKALEAYKYTGIYANSHNRWWWNEVEQWWSQMSNSKSSLRRLKATDRCELIKDKTGFDLIAVEKLKHAKSENFWTICKDKIHPLDPIDGLELNQKELQPWQDTEYISMVAGLESVELKKFVNPSDIIRLKEYENTLS